MTVCVCVCVYLFKRLPLKGKSKQTFSSVKVVFMAVASYPLVWTSVTFFQNNLMHINDENEDEAKKVTVYL